MKEYNMKSEFFKSRAEARSFAKTTSGKIVDHSEKPYARSVLMGAEGYRWEVVYKEAVNKLNPIVIITPKNISITLSDGTQHNLSKSKSEFSKIVALAMEEKYEEMLQYVDIANAVKIFTFGTDIIIENGVLFYYGQEIHTNLSQRIISEALDVNGNAEKYVNFFRKLYKNPSFKAVEHTYDFMVHNNLEILPDGDIKAWKSVSVVDGTPVAARNVPNWKGTTIEMPRNQVEDNPNITCSYGLHIAAKEYAENFSDLLLEVAVSPEDIVSVPVDYGRQKARACKYRILTGLENEDAPRHIIIDKNGNILYHTININII